MFNLLRRFSRSAPIALVLLGLSFAPASNAATLIPEDGSLAYFFITPDGIGSVHGSMLFSFNDPSPIGSLIASDLGAPYPNSTLLLSNESLTESITVTFDPSTAEVNGWSCGPFRTCGFILSVESTGVPNGPLTDPMLVTMLSTAHWNFNVGLNQQIGDSRLYGGEMAPDRFPATNVTVRTTSPSEVPEPGTWLLLSGGLLSVGLIRRRKRG